MVGLVVLHAEGIVVVHVERMLKKLQQRPLSTWFQRGGPIWRSCHLLVGQQVLGNLQVLREALVCMLVSVAGVVAARQWPEVEKV